MLSDRSRFQKYASDESGSGWSGPSATRPLKILIVEDDEDTQKLIQMILARGGHSLVFCSNGNEAVETVKSQQFDLVFMDVLMPLMDGVEATRQIRKWEAGKSHLPIVGLTAIFDSQGKSCIQAGMDDLISKPFSAGQINQTIAACLRDRGPFVMGGSASRASQAGDLPVLDAAGAMKRLGSDPGDYRELLEEFLQGLPARYQVLIDRFRAAQWETLGNHAHNLKGLSASLGAMQLSENALQLEQIVNEGRYNEVKECLHKIETSIQILRARGSGL